MGCSGDWEMVSGHDSCQMVVELFSFFWGGGLWCGCYSVILVSPGSIGAPCICDGTLCNMLPLFEVVLGMGGVRVGFLIDELLNE